MSVSLSKKQTISLTKADAGLKKVFMGLGWDAATSKPVKSGGFFSSLFGSNSGSGSSSGNSGSIDLDASCLMFNGQNLVDTISFRQLRSKDGSVVHTGDNLTGEGDGDDEMINVDLNAVPANVTSLVFVITSFRGQTFNEVESAFCRLVNAETNKELANYKLSDKTPTTAQVMAKVYKENGEWMMQAIGAPADGRVASDLLKVVQPYL